MSEKLAIHGGAKAIPEGLPNRFHFGNEEKAALMALCDQAIASGNAPIYNGNQETEFCREFATCIGAKYADGVNSGTNAVYVAIKALNLPPFSEVIVGCVTDPGGMMPVVINNCIPVPADTMPGSFNTGAEQIRARITPRTSAIVVAHIGGEPANMPEIMKVAEEFKLPVIEDCAQAHYSKINGQNVGTFGRYGAFSLMFGKHICTGGQGGMVVCNCEEDYWNLRRAADRGKPFNCEAGVTNLIPAINCNMDEIHAVIGRAQLPKLAKLSEERRSAVAQLTETVAKLKTITIPDLATNAYHTYWWWRLKFNADQATCTKEEFFAALQAEGLNGIASYTAALPATMQWFQNRADKHPWNNPLYAGNASEEYPTPNVDLAMNEHFIVMIHERCQGEILTQMAKAFAKVDAYFAK